MVSENIYCASISRALADLRKNSSTETSEEIKINNPMVKKLLLEILNKADD